MTTLTKVWLGGMAAFGVFLFWVLSGPGYIEPVPVVEVGMGSPAGEQYLEDFDRGILVHSNSNPGDDVEIAGRLNMWAYGWDFCRQLEANGNDWTQMAEVTPYLTDDSEVSWALISTEVFCPGYSFAQFQRNQ